jgi:hypothetical protein
MSRSRDSRDRGFAPSDQRILSAFMVPPLAMVEANRGTMDLEQLRHAYAEGTSGMSSTA